MSNIKKRLEDAWLNIPGELQDSKIFNPLETIPPFFEESPHLYILSLLQKPEYLCFAAREILNVKLLPIQAMMMREMWTHKFPMLIASRGFGKCEKNSYVETESGFVKIDDLVGNIPTMTRLYTNDLKLRGINGYQPVEYVWKNNKEELVCIETEAGFKKICTNNHPIMTVQNNKIDWQDAGTIVEGTYIPIVRDDNWFQVHNNINEDLAYLFGVLVGDGGYTVRGRITITTEDSEIINRCNEIALKYFGKIFKKQKRGISYLLCSTSIWDRLFSEFGFNSFVCAEKSFPKTILHAKKSAVAAFISGLFDTDGYTSKDKKWLEYCSKSEDLVKTLQFILTKFGIISRVKSRLNKKYNRRYYYLYIFGDNVNIFYNKINFKLTKKVNKLKSILTIKSNTNKDIIPRGLLKNIPKREFSNKKNITYNIAKKYPGNEEIIAKNYYYDKVKRITTLEDYTYDVYIPNDHSFYADGFISHNSFTLAVYSLLRMLLLPGRRIVIAGSAFRQSKIIFNYMENIWRNAPILRDLFSGDEFAGPRREPDMYRFHLGDSITQAIPVGDGCLIGNTMITYKDRFSYIDEGATDLINSRYRYVWGDKSWQLSNEVYNNGFKDTKEIITNKGYKIEGTYNHKLKVLENNEIIWKRLDELKIDDQLLIDKSKRWHDGKIDETIEDCYALGLMIGDGNYTTKYRLGFSTKDLELANAINIIGNFKQANDAVHYTLNGVKNVENWLNKWNLKLTHTIDKIIPDKMLYAEKEKMAALISGLFDTDGNIQTTSDRGCSAKILFTNTSEKLCRQLQYILLHYGIVSKLSYRDRNKKWNRVWELYIFGNNVKTFYEEIGFRLTRKNNILRDILLKKKRFTTQEKYLKNNDIFIDKVKNINNNSNHTYDIHVPKTHEYCANGFLSHNTTIRGLRANDIIVDEFASISREVYEVVIQGFAAVKSDPFSGVEFEAKKKLLLEHGENLDSLDTEQNQNNENQIVISGTAFYDFNHFAEYHKKYHKIITSQGDISKVSEVMQDYEKESAFDYKQYSIMRIPYELIPKGFMDEGIILAAKATSNTGLFSMEYGAVFSKDSYGFFKRSLIESCVVSHENPISINGEEITFTAKMYGDLNKKYVYGIDVASEQDRFAIVILELHPEHRRIVHAWSTNRKEFNQKVKDNLIKETDYYGYCSRKIRELMKRFPCERILMDSQGGGIGVMEALHDKDKLQEGEHPIWPVINPEKSADTDGKGGLHILEMVNFASSEWTSEANHGMKKDFEDKILLFPFFDSVAIELATIEDGRTGKLYDTFEDCLLEIEELKNELSIITITRSSNGRDRWDTPEIKLPGNKKGRLRKDRYSALLMANMGARTLLRKPYVKYAIDEGAGGFAGSTKSKGAKYTGPEWITQSLNDLYN